MEIPNLPSISSGHNTHEGMVADTEMRKASASLKQQHLAN